MSEKKDFKLAYELLPLSKFKENPKNPNVMSEKMFKLLVDNIEREGFKDPIIVRPKDEDGFYLIEDGHHRKMALVELGFEVGPCVVADFEGNLDLSSLMLNKIKGHLAPPNLGIRLGAVFRRRSLITEVKRIQTFPLDFILLGKLKDQYRQLGNAVPPLMSYRLAEALINPIQEKINKKED